MRTFRGLLMGLLLASLWGCSTTHQARRVETSGFLDDYSMLKEGESGEALLVYRNPKVDFSRYDKVLVEPISVWRPVDSDLADVSDDDLQMLSQHLFDAIVEKLKEDYQIVKRPGRGVLRIRAAITEAAKSWVVLDMMTTIIPHSRLLSGVGRLTTGTHSFVGKASVEGEITDAETGDRLLAAVDRRAGGKAIRGSWSSWDDVKEAYNHWAERLRDRLREERKKGSGS